MIDIKDEKNYLLKFRIKKKIIYIFNER